MTGTKYNKAMGVATIVDGSLVGPAFPNDPLHCSDAFLFNNSEPLPLASGKADVQLTATFSPILSGSTSTTDTTDPDAPTTVSTSSTSTSSTSSTTTSTTFKPVTTSTICDGCGPTPTTSTTIKRLGSTVKASTTTKPGAASSGGNLPRTGNSSTTPLAGLGSALVGAGALLAVRRRSVS